MDKKILKWGGILLLVALIWGTTFAVMKDLLSEQTAEGFLFWRFLLAGIFLALLAGKKWLHMDRRHFWQGLLLGLLLYGGYTAQVWGLKYTTASQAGFITGLAVVFVPLLAILAGLEKADIFKVAGVFLAVLGLYLLTYTGSFSMGWGELLVLVCAIFFALYIVFLGRFASESEPLPFVAVQMLFVALLMPVIPALQGVEMPWENLSFSILQWGQILYLGLVATALAFIWEHKAQQILSATFTALALAMEPVFAAIFAFFYLGEALPILSYIGGLLIIVGMLLAGHVERKKETHGRTP